MTRVYKEPLKPNNQETNEDCAKDLRRQFSKGEQMASKHTKCSVSWVRRETQIQLLTRYHFMPTQRLSFFFFKKKRKSWALVMMWKLTPEYTASVSGKWFSHCGKQSGSFLKVKHTVTIWLSNFTPRYRQWHLTPVLLPGESQGWGSLVGCHLWGHTESDTTGAT